MRELDRAMLAVAATQHGAISCAHARSLGLDHKARARRIAAGMWRLETPRVLVLEGTPNSFEQRATIGLLDVGRGSGLAYDTASSLWGIPGFDREPIHIARHRLSRTPPPPGVVIHHVSFLPSHHLLLLNGLATTTPTRTLADLGNLRRLHRKAWERAADNFWARGLTNRKLIVKMESEWCERGRRGSAALHEYLEIRPIEWRPPASNLERRFIELIVEAGMPAPRTQVNIGNEARWLGRVDCYDPDLPLVAEIDSDLHHTAPLDVAADEQRDADMTHAGLRVVRFREFKIWHRPAEVVAEWRAARDEVRRNLSQRHHANP